MCRKALNRAVSLLLAVVLLVGVLPAVPAEAETSGQVGVYRSNTQLTDYVSVIEQTIIDAQSMRDEGYGALYDIDGNGVKELIMIHPGLEDRGLSTKACSLYTMSNGKAIPLIDTEELFVEVAASYGHAAVICNDGKYKFAINYANGDAYYKRGGWKIYTLQGASLTLDTTVEFERSSYFDIGQIDYDSSYATFNGKKCSYREYEEWEEALVEIMGVYPYGDRNTMSLEELLEYLKENPIEDSAESGWRYKNGNWYFYENGAPKIGWLKDGGNWYYMDASGIMQTGWEKVGNAWYYFNGSGVMQTGWLKLGSNWYYLNNSGAMVTGTVTIDGEQHKFDSSGVWKGNVVQSKNGWVSEGGKWYYYTNGTKATGWKKVGNAWYYFNGSGVMQTGWLKLGSNWYYLNNSGAMVTGTVTIDGEQHKFDSSGVWKGKVVQSKNGWVKENGKWYYYKNGTKVTGWVKDGKSWYYMDPSGVMHTGWLALNGKWYYLNSGGAMVTGTVKIDGVTYKFSSSGVWIP